MVLPHVAALVMYFDEAYVGLVAWLRSLAWALIFFSRFFFIWFVRLLALRPLLAYCASLG
jgi:hypothetical protein